MNQPSLPPIVPSGNFQRFSAPWPLRKLRAAINSFKPLRGGPLLDDCTHRHVDCGPVEVDFFEPRAYFGDGSAPTSVDLNDDKTFNRETYDERTKHAFVRLGGSNWSYYSPIWDINRYLPVPQHPYAIITTLWQIERVKGNHILEIGNTTALEDYLRRDYESFLESEGGRNWELRQKFQKEYWKDYVEPEEAQAFVNGQLKHVLLSPPAAYETLNFNGLAWLRYVWNEQPGRSLPTALNYSRTLSNRTILTVFFDINIMGGGSKACAKWWKVLLRHSEALMSGMTITSKRLPAPRA